MYKLSRAFNVTSDYIFHGPEKDKNDLICITEMLKRLDKNTLESVEKIIIEISKIASKN